MRLIREFGRGTTSSLLIIGLGLGLTLASQAVLARWLSTTDYGTFRYVVNLGAIIVLFAQLGLPNIMVRQIAAANGPGEEAKAEIRGHVQVSLYVYAGSVAAFFIVGALVLLALTGQLEAKLFSALLCLLVLVPVDLFSAWPSAVLRGLKRVGLSGLGDNIIVPGVLIVLTGLFWLLGLRGIMPALAVQAIALATSFLIGLWLVRRWLTGEKTQAPLRPRMKTLLAQSLPLALADPLFRLSRYLDVLVLGMFAPMSEVALYAVASRIGILGSFGLRIAGPITGPLIAERYAKGDMRGVENVAFLAAALSTVFAAAFIVVIAVGGRHVLAIFGDEYPSELPLLVIISAGYLVNATMGSVNQLLVMTHHQRTYMAMLVVSTVVDAVLLVVLIPHYGAFGAAYATLGAMLVLCVCCQVAVARLLHINSSIFNFRLMSQIDFSVDGIRELVKAVLAKSPRPVAATAANEESSPLTR